MVRLSRVKSALTSAEAMILYLYIFMNGVYYALLAPMVHGALFGILIFTGLVWGVVWVVLMCRDGLSDIMSEAVRKRL